jgi:plastocyanin
MRRTLIWIAAALTLVTVASPATVAARDRTDRGASHSALASTVTVKIVDFAFRPKKISIAKGTRVRWVNKDSVNHTTTANGGQWDSGSLGPGDAFSRTFKKAGTFRYHCSLHSSMVGKVVVG